MNKLIAKVLTCWILDKQKRKEVRRALRGEYQQNNDNIIGYLHYAKIKSGLQRYINPDKFNFVLQDGLGDTLMCLCYADAFAKKNGADVFFFIRPSHEFIFKSLGKHNYIVVDAMERRNFYYGLDINLFSTPKIGDLFFAHPRLTPMSFSQSDKKEHYDFSDFWGDFLGLQTSLLQKQKVKPLPEMVTAAEEFMKLHNLRAEKTILISPEECGYKSVRAKMFADLARTLSKKGFTVISNVCVSKNKIPGTVEFSGKFELCMALANMCRVVISVRSGLCDMIYEKGKNLYILYQTKKDFDFYSVNKIFDRNDVNEYMFSDDSIVKKITESICAL
ncbi:MAG: hypothetical protein IJS88_05510 [Alphaproteobacteria bacterium]|nr:hypothetical protein [Alphaproteobacteria bacterium]